MTATLADSGQRRPFPKHVSGGLRPFPLEPLVAWLLPDGAGWARPDDYTVGVISTVALRLEVDRNWVHRNLDAGGLGVYVADAVAIHLRVHPVSIWPDWFEHAPDYQEAEAEESTAVKVTRASRPAVMPKPPGSFAFDPGLVPAPVERTSLADLFESAMAEWKLAGVAS